MTWSFAGGQYTPGTVAYAAAQTPATPPSGPAIVPAAVGPAAAAAAGTVNVASSPLLLAAVGAFVGHQLRGDQGALLGAALGFFIGSSRHGGA